MRVLSKFLFIIINLIGSRKHKIVNHTNILSWQIVLFKLQLACEIESCLLKTKWIL